mgnify:CR=1 FL=1
MPQVVLEYTANIKAEAAIASLLKKINDTWLISSFDPV